MKTHKILLLSAIALVLSGVCLVSGSCGTRTRTKGPDTLKVNTLGFNGPTPIELCVYNGVITEIKALPNQETPRFFQRVLDSGLLTAIVGKTPAEARETPLDAVSGATYSSTAVIKNIHLALDAVE